MLTRALTAGRGNIKLHPASTDKPVRSDCDGKGTGIACI